MNTKLVIFAGIMCTMMVLYQVNSEPVEDFLPDTNGLFFGKKRASHPNMNNLLFGRRSYGADANGKQATAFERAYLMCANVKKMCDSMAFNEVPEH